tara:strand:- start:1923 stop:2066 length:144 start_codon:yes stop_codon:yes gene_type:complete
MPPKTAEHKEKISKALKGQKRSGKALENIREGITKGWETRRKNILWR